MYALDKRYGLTITALVCTVVVALLLLATIVLSFNNIINSTHEREFANEIYSIQKFVDNYYFRFSRYPITVDGMPPDFLNDLSYDEDFSGDSLNSEFYIIDLSEAGLSEVKRGMQKNNDENDVYVVSLQTGRVYYVKGQDIGGHVYHTLTQSLKDKLKL